MSVILKHISYRNESKSLKKNTKTELIRHSHCVTYFAFQKQNNNINS